MSHKVLEPTGHIGEHSEIKNSTLGAYTEVGMFNVFDHSQLGDYSYTGQFCILQNTIVGKFSNIAAQVRIGPTDHPMERPTLHHLTYRRKLFGFAETDDLEFFAKRQARLTHIGHDTWIGHGAIIMPEVKIGNGAVVGSGAVVTRDVEPYMIVVGVPAKVVRRRFSKQIEQELESIAWWDWTHAELKENLEWLSGDIQAFIRKFYQGAHV